MNDIEVLLKKNPVNLTNCDLEPIHIPGAIQPYGYLMAIDKTGSITRVSENLCGFLNRNFRDLIGEDLDTLGQSFTNLKNIPFNSSKSVSINQESFTVLCLPSDEEKIFEFEPELSSPSSSKTTELFHENIADLSKKNSTHEIMQELPLMIKKMTGYDRVMIYRFDTDWHGEVIAEAKETNLEPFLGLHYPATDIPVQARELYKKNLTRLISNVDYEPVSLISKPDLGPLDLTFGSLRSISPMHIQYLKNMKVKATLVISLMVHGELWGLVACHHYQDSKYLTFAIRKICESLASVASFGVAGFEEIQRRNKEIEQTKIVNDFFSDLQGSRSFASSLSNQQKSILKLTEARGLSLIENEICSTWGDCPDKKEILKLYQWLSLSFTDLNVYQTHHLKLDYEYADSIKTKSSGLIAIKLPPIFSTHSKDSFLFWFRPEHIESIHWAGNPEKAVNKNQLGQVLSPRNSFEQWIQKKTHQSISWSKLDRSGVTLFRQQYLKTAVNEAERLKKQVEARMAHLERLSSIGELSSGIAHDFNNILLGIQGGAQLIQTTSSLEKARSSSEKIKLFCQRGATLIKGLLKHSRAAQEDYTLADPQALLHELIIFIQTMNGLQIEFEFSDLIDKGPIYFNGNSNEILQGLLNLVNNAKDAYMGKPGFIKIELKEDKPGNSILFTVQDHGKGIPAEIIERIFDPFFSTKGEGKGTGLGLASLRQIVLNHGGNLTVSSELNKGSLFSIILPKASNNKAEGPPLKTVPVAETSSLKILQSAKILYVEDDPDNREVYQDLLSEHFQKFSPAADGFEALQIIASTQIDLVISDLRMPKMDGMSLYRKIRETRKELPFLLATGELLSREQILGQIQDPLFDVASKPFEIEKLLDQCRHLLDSISKPKT